MAKQRKKMALAQYPFYSVFFRNLLLITLVLFIPLIVISGFLVQYSKSMLNNEIAIVSENKVAVMGNQLELFYTELYVTLQSLALEEEVQAFLQNNSIYQVQKSAYITTIGEELNRAKITKDALYSITIYSVSSGEWQTSYGNGIGAQDVTFLQQMEEIDPNQVTFVARTDVSYPYLVSMILPFKPAGTEIEGYIIANINTNQLGKLLLQDNYASDDLYLLDAAETILFCKNSDDIFSSKQSITLLNDVSAQKELTVSYYQAEQWSFSLIYCENNSIYQDRQQALMMKMIGIIGFVILFGIVAVYLVSYKTYQPIQQIIRALSAVDKEYAHSYAQDSISEKNETLYIINSIQQSHSRNADMGQELKRRVRLLNEAQAATFQAQITPHFIYNTLDNFKWKAMELSGGSNSLAQSISKFSKLLHLSIDNKERLVCLSEEMEHSKLYVDILLLRYENLLALEWNIPAEYSDYLLPKLCLQPLIENAVYHGIKPLMKKGLVHIAADVTEGILQITVEDNGMGMSEEALTTLTQRIEVMDYVSAQHVGVRNVNQRIKLIFGEQYGLQIESEENVGTKITISIPVVE